MTFMFDLMDYKNIQLNFCVRNLLLSMYLCFYPFINTLSQKPLALSLQAQISDVFAVDIHPGARIGKGIEQQLWVIQPD